MSIKHRLITVLLGIYPAQWRREYGGELRDLLLTEPLGPGTIGDVVWNAVRERLRSLELATVFGLVAMAAILTTLSWNIVAPQPYGTGWTTLLEPSDMTFPTIRIRPLVSELYALFLMACGCSMHLRHGTTPARSGMSAMKVCFLAGLPIMTAGVLMLLGIMHAIVLGPGDIPTTFREHGFALSYYSELRQPPGSLAVVLAPLARLGESWVWGAVGGSLGRTIARRCGRPDGRATADPSGGVTG